MREREIIKIKGKRYRVVERKITGEWGIGVVIFHLEVMSADCRAVKFYAVDEINLGNGQLEYRFNKERVVTQMPGVDFSERRL